MRSPACWMLGFCFGALVSGGLGADPPPSGPAASPYGATYTAEELAALDRALHAVNCDRGDLEFRKDLAKGTGCFPLVKEMLRDPLRIAAAMDLVARATRADGPGADLPFLSALGLADAMRQDVAPTGWGSLSPVEWRSDEGFAAPAPFRPEAPGPALEALTAVASTQPRLALAAGSGATEEGDGELLLRVLRRRLPDEMAMREVFASPYEAAAEAAIQAHLKDRPPAYVHELGARIPVGDLREAWYRAFGALLRAAPTWPRAAFPADAPLVRDTPFGRIALGTPGPDRYEGDYAVLVDPGGDDTYVNARVGTAFGTEGRRVGLLMDLGGNDVYACRDVDATLGCALLGVAAFLDLGQGNDRYEGGHGSMGAAVGGVALFYDDGGSDLYQAKTFAQGAAGFGLAVFLDDAVQPPPTIRTDEETKDPIAIAAWDNDRLSAWADAQAFARCGGVALCLNTRGNDTYEAGGVYLHAPLFADRYQSFSQGFAIGAREHDMAGGIALLIDREGNDRYLGDIYNQGVGYWYAAGLLWDGGGNDVYEMTQYGQGSGIHLAVGGLVDVAGSDAYLMHSGLGQGGSHDYAASVLMDRGGSDRYLGNTSCNGCGLTNAVGLFFDRGGDDLYASRREGGFNAGRPARGFGSLGVFVDLGGKDDYLGPPGPAGPADDTLWRGSDVGVGIDLPAAAPPPGATSGTSEPNQLTGKAEIPAVCRYEGDLTEAVFDELWALSVRWEVGDNRLIVPEARKRLIAFGKAIVPLLDGKMEKDESGLELRAYVDVLKGLAEAGAQAEVRALLQRNLASPTERRRRVALHLVGELKAQECESDVVALLSGPDEALARRAAGVLALLGSHAGDGTLTAWLAPDGDERRILAALGALLGSGADAYAAARPLLGHPRISVRTRLATLLAEKRAVYGGAVLGDLGASDLVERARRSLLDAVVRGPIEPDEAAVTSVTALLSHADWGVRADAARALRAWADLEALPEARRSACRAALVDLLAKEEDAFVRRAAAPR